MVPMGIIVMILQCHITPGNKEKVCARHPLICVTLELNMYYVPKHVKTESVAPCCVSNNAVLSM